MAGRMLAKCLLASNISCQDVKDFYLESVLIVIFLHEERDSAVNMTLIISLILRHFIVSVVKACTFW